MLSVQRCSRAGLGLGFLLMDHAAERLNPSTSDPSWSLRQVGHQNTFWLESSCLHQGQPCSVDFRTKRGDLGEEVATVREASSEKKKNKKK